MRIGVRSHEELGSGLKYKPRLEFGGRSQVLSPCRPSQPFERRLAKQTRAPQAAPFARH